jgi:hypothetical protein
MGRYLLNSRLQARVLREVLVSSELARLAADRPERQIASESVRANLSCS